MALNNASIGSTAYIQGARIGICSQRLEIQENAIITAEGQGCSSLNGRGSLRVNSAVCSAPGASYGGRGGHSALFNATRRRIIISSHIEGQQMWPVYPRDINDDECAQFLGNEYGDERELIFEGSGGPSTALFSPGGGNGGGLIQINVQDELVNNGTIIADGANPRINSTSGGGSGGSIQIITTYLSGIGNFSTKGGNGTWRNSGGGAGGRLSIRFWKSRELSVYPRITKDWIGAVSRHGGRGSGYGGNGQKGSIYSTPCQAGYSGTFCTA